MTDWILIGAGGHAKAIVEGLREAGDCVCAYVDPRRAEWLPQTRQIASDEDFDPALGQLVLGIGGQTPDELERRLALLSGYCRRGGVAPAFVHSTAIVSASAALGEGTAVLAGAVVQPNVRIGRGVIVNTQAIVEHDSTVGDGAHIAPGAVVLGDCHVGRCTMIGTRAVVLPGARVPDAFVVTAGTLYRPTQHPAS
jgi:sugar O-acyltransferase (sialic acid O-acetyltransferase NeuD family)